MKNTKRECMSVGRAVGAARALGPWLGHIESPLISEAEWEAVLKPLIGNKPDAADRLARFLFQLESALESGPDGVEWAKSALHGIIEDIEEIRKE